MASPSSKSSRHRSHDGRSHATTKQLNPGDCSGSISQFLSGSDCVDEVDTWQRVCFPVRVAAHAAEKIQGPVSSATTVQVHVRLDRLAITVELFSDVPDHAFREVASRLSSALNLVPAVRPARVERVLRDVAAPLDDVYVLHAVLRALFDNPKRVHGVASAAEPLYPVLHRFTGGLPAFRGEREG